MNTGKIVVPLNFKHNSNEKTKTPETLSSHNVRDNFGLAV